MIHIAGGIILAVLFFAYLREILVVGGLLLLALAAAGVLLVLAAALPDASQPLPFGPRAGPLYFLPAVLCVLYIRKMHLVLTRTKSPLDDPKCRKETIAGWIMLSVPIVPFLIFYCCYIYIPAES